MPIETVATSGAPRAIGPYSQALRAGGFLFTAGQVGFDPGTGELVDGGIGEQTRQVLQNIRAILEAGGSRPAIESFRAFRGRDPSLDALLRHQGMA